MREKLKRFAALFSSPKANAIVNAFCALFFFVCGVRTLPYPHNHWLGGISFFNAMIFAASTGLNFALHFELQNRKITNEIIDNQDEFIDELISELRMLREKDAS